MQVSLKDYNILFFTNSENILRTWTYMYLVQYMHITSGQFNAPLQKPKSIKF